MHEAEDVLPAPDGDEVDYIVSFGNVALDDRETRTVDITNSGSAAMNVDRVPLSAPFGSDIPADGLVIEPGLSKPVIFTFSPSDEGETSAVATVAYNGGEIIFRLEGKGVSPDFSCVPQVVDFGTVEVRSTGHATVRCTNNTELETTLIAGPLTGDGKDFFQYMNVSSDGTQVPPGAEISIPVVFNASGRQERFAKFSLYAASSSADGEDELLETIELRGTPIESAIMVEPEPLFFGHVPPGAKIEKALTVRNLGSNPLNVTALALDPTSSADFTLKTRAPIAIPPDDRDTPEKENEAEIVIEFAPSSLGAKNGFVQITNSSNGNPVAQGVLEGFGGGPIISCSPGSLDFGPTAVGIPNTREYVCTNAGTDAPGTTEDNLKIESVSVGNDAEFSVTIENDDGSMGERSGGYAVGEFFTVRVEYAPIDTGVDDDIVEIASTDALTPVHQTTITGDGRELPPCDFEIVPPNLRFGIVAPGKLATLEFAIRNNLDTECLITNVRLSEDTDPSFHVDEIEFESLPGNGELRIPVTFSPPERLGGDTSTIFDGEVLFDISNPDDAHQVVPLKGASQEPCALIAPEHLDFGTVAPECSTRERFFTIINVCDEDIVIPPGGIELNAGASNEFHIRQEPPYPATLGRGEQVEFTMVYIPQDEGEDLGSIFVSLDSDGDMQPDGEPYMATLQGRGANDALQTDTFSQDDRPKVDLLWVIDTSGSMSQEQDAIADNLSAFLSFAVAQQIDFQLGVTTTATTENSCESGVSGPDDGRLKPIFAPQHERILTPTTPDLDNLWARNVDVGTCGVYENGLEAAHHALSPGIIDVADATTTSWGGNFPEPNDGNLGFLRRDANLGIIFVSDEEDQSPETTDFYYNFFMSIKGFRNSNMFSAHAIVADPVTSCSPGGSTAGDRYYDVAIRSGGIFQSICTEDWTAAMERIGTNAFGFKTRFFLSNVPEDSNSDGKISDRDGELEVRINGNKVPSINSRLSPVWEYVPDVGDGGGAIDFYPLFVPEPGSQIEVTYTVACLPGT